MKLYTLCAAVLMLSSCAPAVEEQTAAERAAALPPVGDASIGPLIDVETYGADGKTAAVIKVPNVQAKEIAAAFDANEVAAFQKYGGKLIAVTGVVEQISLDIADDPVVSLLAGEHSSFNANFDKERGAATAQLRKGQEATIVCSDIREFAGSPSLNDCWLII